jgi:hypothetical protein
MSFPSLDNLSRTIDSATTGLSKRVTGVTSMVTGAASSLSAGLSGIAGIGGALSGIGGALSGIGGALSGIGGALSGIGGSVNGLLSAFGTAFSPLPDVALPLKNPLFEYASYDYILGLACLTNDQLNSPDTGYMTGPIPYQIIAKDANADPANRVKIAYGSFDYFLDKLEIQSTIGLEKGANTNMHKMTFSVTEPYSMGTFMMSLQQAAWNAGHDNYTQAPYLLTIEFRGSKENGVMSNIPNTSRRIPFRFKEVSMTVTEAGAVYQCEGYPWSSAALSAHVSGIKNDASVKGTTVQEVLQTGEKSLQVVMNKRLQQLKTDGEVRTPDQIVILFPTDVSSKGAGGNSGDTEEKSSATTQTDITSVADVAKKLGLSKSTVPANTTLVQDPANVNSIGKAKMGFSDTRKGDAPVGKDQKVVVKGNVIRGNNTVDPQTSDLRFAQDTDITSAIDTVLLNSDYATSSLEEQSVDDKGQRKWWRIDTQVFNITDKANLKKTGDVPRVIVYRIVPYGVHTSKLTAPNTKAPGFEELKKQVVKEYNYIYTGKNVDILQFNIEVKTGFAGKMGATSIKKTIDNQRQAAASGAESTDKNSTDTLDDGKAPAKKLGVQPQRLNFSGTSFGGTGGGGIGTEQTLAAQQFHEAITSSASMIALDMKIIGDPYWIAQSGMGNYTAMPSQYQNLNNDGSVNYQNGEVDITVNFRSPVDINQSTGLYDFGKSAGNSVPLLQWSGLYQVTQVVSNFDGGSFTQKLTGPRRNGQEQEGPGSAKNTANVTEGENTQKQAAPATDSTPAAASTIESPTQDTTEESNEPYDF